MNSKLARLGTLSFEGKIEHSVSETLTDPFKEIRRIVRTLIIATAICIATVAIIAFVALGIAWHSLHKQVDQNEENIVALCREQNANNKDLRTIALDLGVPAFRLTPLLPKPCNIERFH